MQPLHKAKRLMSGTMLVFALLVATHLGEFWPFSIYPMFSQGGRTWSRAIVREVVTADSAMWRTVSVDDLPGTAFPMDISGANQNDLANFVSKSSTWNAARVGALRSIFGESSAGRSLLVMRAEGRLDEDRQVQVTYTPYMILSPDTTVFNPTLTFSFE